MLVRLMAEEDLAELGLDVTSADTGDDGFVVLAHQRDFDLLFTDIRMPGDIDGWELARRARELVPTIKVIYVSGFPGEATDPVDGSRFLKKPYRFDELREALSAVGLHG